MVSKGILIAIGGAEDKGTDPELGFAQRKNLKFFELGILKRIAELLPSKEAIIEVITSASSIPDEVGLNYQTAFAKIGCPNVGHISIRNRNDTQSKEYYSRLQGCDAVMFSGGNQMRLTAIFGGSDFFDLLEHRYHSEPNFIIAGTSAGAMVMSKTMIYEGHADKSHLKGEVKITTGFGLVEGVIIDSHFDKRGRFPRLAQSVIANPSAVGIGLSEDTAVIIRGNYDLEAIGSGAVYILDGRNIQQSNIADIEDGSPISAEGLIVHIMEMGDHYNFKTRRLDAHVPLIKPKL